jgi:hypothetical protein
MLAQYLQVAGAVRHHEVLPVIVLRNLHMSNHAKLFGHHSLIASTFDHQHLVQIHDFLS